MRDNKLPTSFLYNELSTNGDEPKSPILTLEWKGHLETLYSAILNSCNRSEAYFYWLTLVHALYFSISKPKNCFNNPRSVIENTLCNEDLNKPISTMQLPVIKISSTYSTMIWIESYELYKYTIGSYFHLSKPCERRNLSILA